jgi:hypothetical protein
MTTRLHDRGLSGTPRGATGSNESSPPLHRAKRADSRRYRTLDRSGQFDARPLTCVGAAPILPGATTRPP